MAYVIIRNNDKSNLKAYKKTKLRYTSNFLPTIFNNDLVVSFSKLLNSLPEVDKNNLNIVFSNFQDRFRKVCDRNAPFKMLSRKRSKLAYKLCISKGISVAIRNKQKIYKTHLLVVLKLQKRYTKLLQISSLSVWQKKTIFSQ